MAFVRSIRDDIRLAGLILGLLVAMAIATALLFAFPIASGWMGFALPFVTLVVIGGLLFAMNLRWSLWHGRRPFFFAIADFGFITCFAAFAFYSTASVVMSSQAIGWVLVGAVALAIARIAFLEFEAWYFGLLLGAALLLALGRYVSFTILHPEWFFDFMTAVLLLAGVVLITAGSIGSLRSRTLERRLPPGLSSRVGLGWALAVLLLAAVSGVATVRGVQAVPEVAQADAVFVFSGGGIVLGQLRPGDQRVLVKNNDPLVHSFTVREVDRGCLDEVRREQCWRRVGRQVADVVLGPGSERLVQLRVDTNYFQLSCRVPGQVIGPDDSALAPP